METTAASPRLRAGSRSGCDAVEPMKATVIAEGAERTFVLVFETGDEVIDEITGSPATSG